MSNIKKVIDNGYCIGCGACAIADPNFTLKRDEYGLITAKYNQAPEPDLDNICPFATNINENDLGNELFQNTPDINHDKKIGYYLNLYAGYTTDRSLREKTTAGGLTTWLLNELLSQNLIDGVIHVSAKKSDPDLFEYTVSTNIEEVTARSKSRYYHVSFSDIEKFLNNQKLSGQYAFVGVPCYIKAVRLLCRENPKLSKHITYFFGIFCGHMKTSAFGELLAWQQGVHPKEISEIDFRVKNLSKSANRYSVTVKKHNSLSVSTSNYRLYGTDWGLGYFKPKACDWCDDISAELADIVFGDAWLPQYTQDPLGTNIIIVRNPLLEGLLKKAADKQNIYLENISSSEVIASQAANYRHRQEGLSIRIEDTIKNKSWFPKKRIQPHSYQVTDKRKKIYRLREKLAEKSHIYFLQAKQKNSLLHFFFKMQPLEMRYNFINNRFIKGLLKNTYYLLKILTKSNKRK